MVEINQVFCRLCCNEYDKFSGDGLMSSHPMGKESSKTISFTLPEMTADFINAYVTVVLEFQDTSLVHVQHLNTI